MHWIWPDSYFEPTESAWLSTHKFGYLNCLSGEQLGKAIRGGQTAGPTPRRLSELIAAERESGRRPDAASDVLRAYTRAEAFSGHAQEASAPYVRYCHSCLQQWYHATAFQFLPLQSCPLHAEPLREECWNCGARWTVDFLASEYKVPLHCHRCGEPLAGGSPRFAELFPRTQPAAAAIADLDRRLRNVCASTSVQADLPEREIALQLHADLLCAGTRWPACVDIRRIALLRLHERRSHPRYELQDFRDAARQVRAVGRRLARLFPGCRSHRAVEQRWEEWAEGFGPKAVSLLVPVNGCVRCWALTLWRCQFMHVFAIVHDPARFEAFFKRRRPLVNEGLGFDLSNAAALAWASFGWCALAVARLARILSNPHEREHLLGVNADGLLMWCDGPPQRCVYRRRRDGALQACCIAPSEAASALENIPAWHTSEWLTRYAPTRWGETLFETMYRPKDYVNASYAWGWEDEPIGSDRH